MLKTPNKGELNKDLSETPSLPGISQVEQQFLTQGIIITTQCSSRAEIHTILQELRKRVINTALEIEAGSGL